MGKKKGGEKGKRGRKGKKGGKMKGKREFKE